MKRRAFLTSIPALLSVPFVSHTSEQTPKTDKFKLNHLYPGAYHEPNDLWTPEEITEAGFVFVEYPTFIHRYDDPYHPIMKSYIGYGNNLDPNDPNYKPMICKTSRYCGIGYYKTDDYYEKQRLDIGRWRGMESVRDYLGRKDIFKPQIIEWMKKMEYHYVYRVMLEDSPCSWVGTYGNSDMIYHCHALNVRGCKLPKI
jgi:hypothetical protein